MEDEQCLQICGLDNFQMEGREGGKHKKVK